MIIYVLRLAEGKYYVGKTKNVEARIQEHIAVRACAWTRKYAFESLYATHEGDDFDEDKFVIKYMDMFGVDSVRGGIYSNTVLTFDQRLNINKQLNHIHNKCLRCGYLGHFIDTCSTLMCYRCCRRGHSATECSAQKYYFGGKLNGCYRCGREDHWAIRCNRTNDVFGKKLDTRCSIM